VVLVAPAADPERGPVGLGKRELLTEEWRRHVFSRNMLGRDRAVRSLQNGWRGRRADRTKILWFFSDFSNRLARGPLRENAVRHCERSKRPCERHHVQRRLLCSQSLGACAAQ